MVLASWLTIACSFGEIGGNDVGDEPDDTETLEGGPKTTDMPATSEPTAEPGALPGKDPASKPPSSGPVSPAEAQALGVLEANCGSCHGVAGAGGISYIADKDALIANGKIVKGDPESSPIYNMMSQQRMPPASVTQRPTTGDIEIVRQWIKGLADVAACTHDGGFVSPDDVYATLADDILTQDTADRPFIRYLGVVNAYNAGACGAALEREQYALLKTINSLSTEPRITQPEAVDPRHLIYRIDLRDYGWNRAVEVQPGDTKIEVIGGQATVVNSDPRAPLPFDDAWEAILSFSAPYAVELVGEEADLLKQQTETLVPYLQVDAFLAAATTQNLYYALIDAPPTLGELFTQLGIDQADQIERNIAKRAGFSTSGVSKQERSVMRFETNDPGGYFWASFDFADNNKPNVSIYTEPLASDAGAAGGEFIYSLPNGMMGFYVAANNGTGSRLTEAPVDVVVDPSQVKNNGAVTNGVSCNSCHQGGIFPFTDKVRDWVLDNQLTFDRDTFEAVLDLYPTGEVMTKLVDADTALFQANLKASGVPVNLADPVSRLYLDFVGLQVQKARAAGDLGVKVALLEAQITRLDPRLHNVLNQGIDRELFDALYRDAFCTLQSASQNRPVDCP
jgi:serine/threonine-protein kinase